VDALADEPEQADKSPYAYTWNNPIKNTDPDGKCPSCLVGGLLGAAVEYGTQVASNALKDGGLTRNAFTKNINMSAILLAGVEGAATQGASAGRKLLVKSAVIVANNVGSAGTDDSGQFKTTVETNGLNIIKNTAIDAMSDITTGAIINPIVKGKASNVIKKVAGSEGNKLASGVKTMLRKADVDVTKKINNTVKQTSKNIVKKVPEKTGDTAENIVKIVTSKPKDEIKEKGNF